MYMENSKNIENLKGKLISLFGKDKVGKSTLAKSLFNYLEQLGFKVLLVHEPGGTEIGKKIRELIKTPNISAKTRMFLYLADRTELALRIAKALQEGYIVISDRSYLCSLGYQMLDSEIYKYFTYEEFNSLNKKAINNIIPDYAIYINADNKEIMKRIANEKANNKLENGWDFFENLNFLNGLDNSFDMVIRNCIDSKSLFSIINTTEKNERETFIELLKILKIA